MKLDRVTITGADNSIEPSALIALSDQYPFAEWGILASCKSMGKPRFPTIEWIQALQSIGRGHPKMSLHICGQWVRELLLGVRHIPLELFDYFECVQLNFHGEKLDYSLDDFCTVLSETVAKRQVIFQIDGNMGQVLIAEVTGAGCQTFDPVPLFDVSHGAGVLAKEWPQPFDDHIYHGYAGGLGPDNLAEQIPLIAAAAGDARIWIDMETRVRSNGDRQFDLALVEQCLSIAAPFVQ